MADDLKVKMSADVEALLRNMKRAEKSLQDFRDQAARFKKTLADATDPATIIRLNRALEASEKKIKQITTAGTVGAAKMGKDFTGLSRIIQDLPFGFVGIQNNITQLLPAAGAAGLALSVVVSALTFAQVGTAAWTRGLTGLQKQLDENKKKLQEFQEAQRSNAVDFQKQRVEIESLVAVAKSDVATKDQQARALSQLNKLIPDNIGVLTKQNLTTAEGTRILNEYTKAIEARGIAELLSARIAELSVQQIDNRSKFTKELTQLILKQNDAEKRLLAQRQKFQISNNDFAKEKYLREEVADLQGQQVRLTNQYKSSIIDLNGQIANYRKEAIAAFTAATPLEEFDKEKTKKKVETITDVIAELSREIDFLNAKSIAFGTNEAKAKISAIESAAEKLIKDFKVAPDDALINKLFFGGKVFNPINNIDIPGIKGLTQEIQERIKLAAPTTPTEIKVPIIIKPEIKPIDQKAFIKQLRAIGINEGIQALAADMQATISNAFGDAITNGLSGKNVGAIFGSFFKQILTALGAGIQQIGVQTLVAGKAIVALKKLFGSAAGIGASIALIALGGIIKGLANRIEIPGFADGVTGFRGGMAMVGERGPELVRLPSGADVIPNHSLGGAIGGGMSVDINGNFRVAGTDLVLVLERANKSLNRVG